MKYGKWLRNEVEVMFPDWKGQFMSYKSLKKQLKKINPRLRYRKRNRRSRLLWYVNSLRGRIGFTRMLDSELNKAITFYFDKEEDYVITLKELRARAENLESEEERIQVQKDILDFHGEMVLLLQFSVLNYTGLIKIVKKHNKRTGIAFQFSLMATVMQQPNFSTDLLFKLMEECEALLQSL